MPTAEDFYDQALRMVAACESVEAISLDPSRSLLGLTGGTSTAIAERAVARQGEMLAGLAGFCNALSTELLKREEECRQFTAEMQRYRAEYDAWLSENTKANTIPGYPYSPGPRPKLPEPPFPGAEAS